MNQGQMNKDNQPTSENNQSIKINVMSLNEPGDGYPVNDSLKNDIPYNTVGVDVQETKELLETDAVKNHEEQNEEVRAVNLIGDGVDSSKVFEGANISSESFKSTVLGGEELDGEFNQNEINREGSSGAGKLNVEAQESGYLDLSSELSGSVSSQEGGELPVLVNSEVLPVDTESYSLDEQPSTEEETEDMEKLKKDVDVKLAMALESGSIDPNINLTTESENGDVDVLGSDVEIGSMSAENDIQQQGVYGNKIKEEVMNTAKSEKNISAADDYFARKSAEMLPDKKLIDVINEIEIVNSELKTAKELHGSLAEQYSTVESETASVLGGGEPSALKEEVETTNDKVIELESKLEEQVQELTEYLKNNPDVLVESKNEMDKIIDIQSVKELIENIQNEVKDDREMEGGNDEKIENKQSVEVVITSQGGLGGAIREALKKLSATNKVGEVFDNFTLGILEELSTEGMSREEAVEAYRAMVKSLEASNGVIKVERDNAGKLRAYIVDNASEQGVLKMENNIKMTNGVADDYNNQMAA